MDVTILEARNYVSGTGKAITRSVNDYEIDMECASGRIYSLNGSHRQILSSGDILIRKPMDYATSSGEQNSYILTLDFSGTERRFPYSRHMPGTFQPKFENPLISGLDPIIHPVHVNDFKRIYQNLIVLPNKNTDAAKELVRELICLLNAEMARKNYEREKERVSTTETIIDYMQNHLDQPITLETLSKLVHLERSYLLRLFRSETGKTPIDALIEMRLDKASDLVAATDLRIGEIALECGYRTVSFFIASYKRRYGVTPDAHRRMIRESKGALLCR